MAVAGRASAFVCLLLIGIAPRFVFTDSPGDMGIAYGLLGSDLPTPAATVRLLQSCTFRHVRLYNPNTDVLNAIMAAVAPRPDVLIGTLDQDLPNLAGSMSFAVQWVASYVRPYKPIIRGIVVGNEAIPGPLANFVVPAMRNLRAVLDDIYLLEIFVTTTLFGSSLANSFPPSASVFTPEVAPIMADMARFMYSIAPASLGPVLVHVYPYFAYAGNPKEISLDYALFRSTAPSVQDGQFVYRNLFDAMFDSYVWALEKVGGKGIPVEVGETGWPSAGNGEATTLALAAEYNTQLYFHVTSGRGTPKSSWGGLGWPKVAVLFSLFNENQKQAGVEQNWGLFRPDMTAVYRTPMCPS